MSDQPPDLRPVGDGRYEARVTSLDGVAVLTLSLADAPDESDGTLRDDLQTARAVLVFLLRHQDAADLPPIVEIADVLAAYDDSAQQIAALRADA